MIRVLFMPPASLRFGKVQAINEQAYGWWITDDGRVMEVDSAKHGEAAFTDIVKKRKISLKGAPAGINVRDFAMQFMGWIRVVNQGDLLEIECWHNRISKRALDSLSKFIGSTFFTDYSLDVRVQDPGSGGNFNETYEAESVKRMLGVMRRNVVQQIAPEGVMAARKRIIAYMRQHPGKRPQVHAHFN